VQYPGGVAVWGSWEHTSQGARPGPELQNRTVAEAFWNVAPKRVRAPYAKRCDLRVVFPEYRRIRESRREFARTTS
jgi:hypothetical protein